MKKTSLPMQLLKIMISLIISMAIIEIVFDSIYVSFDDVPRYMEVIKMALSIFFALLVVIIYDYNGICKARSMVQKGKQDVKSAISIRRQLIEKAEKVVEKYVDKETAVYKNFADSRKSENDVALSFKAIAEASPKLNSNAGVQKLLVQLEDAEKLILQYKNQCTYFISEYNTIIHTFPVVLVKPIFKWKDEESVNIFEDEMVTDQELGI